MTGSPWPPGLHPSQADLYVVNERVLHAPPERLYALLVGALGWPQFYPHARRVRLEGARVLAPGVVFHWTTLGIPVHTTVTAAVPGEELAWSGHGLGARGHHRWQLSLHPLGTQVRSEEVQRGLGVRLLRRWLAPRLWAAHEAWLDGLARAAAS